MRIAVLSDIHGNLPALQAVLDDMEPFAVDGLVIAGDTACGPQVNECIQLLSKVRCWAILGNNEEYMLQFAANTAPPAWKTHLQFGLVRWAYQQLTPHSIEYFRSLPSQYSLRLPGADPICIVHGAPGSASESIFPTSNPAGLDRALAQITESVLVCGHTHLPWQQRRNGKLALNPGAVGGSLDGDARSRYMLLTWEQGDWQVNLRAVAYNLGETRAAFHHSGFSTPAVVWEWLFCAASKAGATMAAHFSNMPTGWLACTIASRFPMMSGNRPLAPSISNRKYCLKIIASKEKLCNPTLCSKNLATRTPTAW